MSIMNFNPLKNESGLTLVELIVTMGLSSLLIVMLVSGSIFIQKYLAQWRQQGALTEELAFVKSELQSAFASAQHIQIDADTLTTSTTDGITTTYAWPGGSFTKNGRALLQSGVKVRSLTLEELTLTMPDTLNILSMNMGGGLHSRYRISVAIESERGYSDSLSFLVRHTYAFFKYKAAPVDSLDR